MTALEDVRCPLCGEDKTELLMEVKNTHGSRRLSEEKFDLVKCRVCGLVYINPRPAQGEIEKYYEKDYYIPAGRIKRGLEKAITPVFISRQKKLVTGYKQEGKLLDIGCGGGDFLASLNPNNFDLYGVEPNKEGFQLSLDRVKGKILNNQLIDCGFPDDYFDVVTMWHVFEHLPDPNRQLQEIRRILKETGLLIIAVPNFKSIGSKLGGEDWFHLDCPRHLYHYYPSTIKRLLSNNGFQVLKVVFPSIGFPFDVYHSLINIFKGKFIKTVLAAPFLTLSLILKPLASLFKVSETMMILCNNPDYACLSTGRHNPG